MIPYDDLVAALTTWRARQGLPVASGAAAPGSGPTATPMTGSGPTPQYGSGPTPQYGSGPTPQSGSGPVSQYGSGPTAKPGSGPARSGPPAPPKGGYQPPPLASPDTADDALDVDSEALLEEAHYENEGADFGVSFGAAVEKDEEATSHGEAPARDSFGGETEFDPPAPPPKAPKTRKPW